MRQVVLSVLRRAGFVLHRWPSTRVDGMADALGMMHTRGYRPRIVIDCGANQGQWMEVVDAVFPGTTYHAIEPQPRCATILRARMADRPDLVVHETAVSSRGVAVVRMIGGGDGTGTGNYVATPGEDRPDRAEYPAATLAGRPTFADLIAFMRAKDFEFHDIATLNGRRADRRLQHMDVVFVRRGSPLTTDCSW